MSSRELAKTLIDQIPESKMLYVISYLQGAAVPEAAPQPNSETLAAMTEIQAMIESGQGQHFVGATADFLASILED